MAKRYYKIDERVWIVGEKADGIVTDMNIDEKEMTVEYKDKNGNWQEYTGKFWEFDKYRKKNLVDSFKAEEKHNEHKSTYFASVKGGVVPKKEDENAGYDCYARVEGIEELNDGIHKKDGHYLLPKLQVTKVPLGFASYLNKEDLLYIGMERSSVGATGALILSGLIDSTYQGEVILQIVPLVKDIYLSDSEKVVETESAIYYPISKALAQAVVLRQSEYPSKEVSYDELLSKPSSRGTGRFGSTGK